MNIDPRLRDLLAKYPLDLTDEELAELRAGAEEDPRVDQIMDGILEVDDQLDDTPVPLSDAGRSRLDALVGAAHEARGWSADLATPAAQTEDEAKGWSADLATPAAEAETASPTPSNVVDLASRRRSRQVTFLAIAAALVIGGVLALQTGPSDPEYQPRGELEDIEAALWVMGDARIHDGDARSVASPVTFRAVLEGGSVSLVLLETQGVETHVIWPAVGAVWTGIEGSNTVGNGGAAPYRPGAPGRAEYHLVAATPAPDIRGGAVVLETFIATSDGRILDRIVIDWIGGTE
jgi:hypothetical protein